MRDSSQKLGRGLATLLGRDTEPSHSGDAPEALRTLRVDEIGPNPDQPRTQMDEASLRELTASVAAQGLLQPVLVREATSGSPRYLIIAGERRWRAARAAGLVDIPCVVRRMSDSEASVAALVENLQREDLNALDEAEGMQRAISRFGMTQDALGQAIGKSRSHVANTLRLLQLPEMVREALRSGQLTAGHARALLTHADPEAAARVVIARGLNVRQTEALGASAAPDPTPRSSHNVDPDVQALEHELCEKLGLSVTIAGRGGVGRLTIRYRTLAQLDGLIALLSRA